MIEAGMNIARLNCSHGDWESKRQWITWIRELSPSVAPIAILADLSGPKFRVGDIPGGSLQLAANAEVSVGPNGQLPINQPEVLEVLTVGTRVILGDGEVEIQIVREEGDQFVASVVDPGEVKSRKGISVVGKAFRSSALTEKDLVDLREASNAGVDFVALSYVRHAEDIRLLRWELGKIGCNAKICAKIETPEAVRDISEILEESDMIMVARGDLGLQMDIEEVPVVQKRIINHCGHVGKPVITATQMLESMMTNSRPTRAEASDVFNAILDGTDSVMLSGETAAGNYPLECVKVMSRLATQAEAMLGRTLFDQRVKLFPESHTDAIARSVADLEAQLEPAAILTTSTSGQTPRLVSKFRGETDILCGSWENTTVMYMAAVWGVSATFTPAPASTEDISNNAINQFVQLGRLKDGDLIILTAGVPPGKAGSTNLIMTQTVKSK
jgi:pyruvate kinase